MSLKIKNVYGEIFDLPSDYVIEAEKNNPLFTNKGSKTVPIHFPDTNNNRKLLQHTDRLDKAERPETIPVIVETDSSQQSGLMAINSGFNAGIGFDESEMYNKMSSMLLRDIPNLPTFTPGAGSLDNKLNAMLSHLTAVMKDQTEADYYVFPICLDMQTDNENINMKYHIILNEVERIPDPQDLPYGRIGELLALDSRTVEWYQNGEIIYLDVPKGYGVSPFLKVFRILELIFNHFGFIVEENPFKEHRQLKKMVVLNNTMDTILTGSLHYKDMMPDITINDFLDGLYNKFGMLYNLNSNTRTVRIKFLKDILVPMKSGSIDLTNFKTEEPSIAYSSPKQLKLIANREIEGSETMHDTYEEFLETYNYQFTELKWDDSLPVGVTSWFNAYESIYRITDVFNSIYLESSDFFDWDKKDELDYEEIKMDDLCIPFTNVGPYYYLFYSVNFKHFYSEITISGSTETPEQNPAKLAFVFAWGITEDTHPGNYNYFFASQYNRDRNGNWMYDQSGKKYDFSLTINREDGLFNRFWKEYDAFLRHSNFEVKCNMKLSDVDVFNFDMFKTAVINSQPLIPKQIKYKLNEKDGVTECTFQTLRLYEPYAEQEIPIYDPQTYKWGWTDVKNPNTEDQYIANGTPYRYVTGRRNSSIIIDGEEIDTKKIAMMPPTEEQYLNQEKRIFVYKYFIATIDPVVYTHIEETVTYTPEIITY